MKHRVKKILREEFSQREETIEEGAVANWLTATALVLGSLAPNSSIAQKFNKGNDEEKVTILSKIKSGAENGDEKLTSLFNKIKKKAEVKKDDNEAKSNTFSVESFEQKAKELGGVVGVGKSIDLSTSKKIAIHNAKAKIGSGVQIGTRLVDQIVFKNSQGEYVSYVILVTSQKINEEQPATNQEYLDTFDDIFDWSQNTRFMIGQGDRHLNSLGLESVIMKSDSDNLIIKYAVDDNNRVVYMIGMMAKGGRFTREDVPDYRLWINRLMDYLRNGYTMVTTANEYSQKLINSLKSQGVTVTHRGDFNMGDNPNERFKHLVLTL